MSSSTIKPPLPAVDRQWVLVSHANPEDNAVATWFATQLANEGYRVWSDVVCLIGGEDFWRDIEDVIRYRAAKVVYLLSRASNQKDGCIKELHAAQGVARKEGLKDFIIPLRIDDIPFGEANIRISNLNIVESRAWKDGLSALLSKLAQDAVPRRPAPDHREISAWWRGRFSTSQSVVAEPELLWSNWFTIENPQLTLYRHRLRRSEIGPIGSPGELPWPTIEDQTGIWTFAPADAVSAKLEKPYYIDKTDAEEITHVEPASEDARQLAFRLLSIAIEAMLRGRGLIPHSLAGGKQCFAFPKALVDNDEASFRSASGKQARRAMVGYKTRIDSGSKPWTRHWHFAIQPMPMFRPEMVVMVRSHVLFSSDGKTIWQSAEKLQRARKNQCKNWWNDSWRDRLHAAMSWLANGADSIELDVGASKPVSIGASSIRFESPVTYATSVNVTDDVQSAVSEEDRLGDEEELLSNDDDDDDDEDDEDLDQENGEPGGDNEGA